MFISDIRMHQKLEEEEKEKEKKKK